MLIKEIDINKLVVSNKFPIGKQDFKYFIGYKDSKKVRSLCIFRPQMIIYKRNFDENRHIFCQEKKRKFQIYGNFRKVGNIIKKKFNNEFIYSKNHLKAERKRYFFKLGL